MSICQEKGLSRIFEKNKVEGSEEMRIYDVIMPFSVDGLIFFIQF